MQLRYGMKLVVLLSPKKEMPVKVQDRPSVTDRKSNFILIFVPSRYS